MARRRSRKIRFPLTVRQAQKLAANSSVSIASLVDAIGLDSDSDRARLQAELARMAAKSPSALIYQGTDEVAPQSSSPWDSDEGDAQPHSSLESEENEQGSGDPLDLPGEGSDRGASNSGDRSETGEILTLEDGKSENEVPTSEGQGEDGKSQSSDRQLGESLSTAMGDSDRPDGISALVSDQPRDAGAQEPANSQDQNVPQPQDQEEGNQGSDDRPAHQKKWGKKFSKAEVSASEVSASADNSHGGVTAKLHKFGINTKLVQLCRQRLSLLVGDSSLEYSHRRDYAEFCIRLKTYRNPSSARKEEEGRPAILIMADVSGSCSSFSNQSVAVAKAASQLGVPGADVLVITHSNGSLEELEHNGKPVPIGLDVDLFCHEKVVSYETLIRRFNISVVIALGDWDAVDCYLLIAANPIVERLIWLDKGYSSQVRDRTKWALTRIISDHYSDISQIRHKLTYRDGCRDAVTFVNNIK